MRRFCSCALGPVISAPSLLHSCPMRMSMKLMSGPQEVQAPIAHVSAACSDLRLPCFQAGPFGTGIHLGPGHLRAVPAPLMPYAHVDEAMSSSKVFSCCLPTSVAQREGLAQRFSTAEVAPCISRPFENPLNQTADQALASILASAFLYQRRVPMRFTLGHKQNETLR
jgi:hypothetical protein